MHDARWQAANGAWLRAAIAAVWQRALARISQADEAAIVATEEALAATREASQDQSAPPALEVLGDALGLTGFERDVLLLCAGAELESTLPAAAPLLHPTVALAMRALREPDRHALSPSGVLRRLQFIDVAPADAAAHSALRIDERTLAFLSGVNVLDERLVSRFSPVNGEPLPPSQHNAVERLCAAWTRLPRTAAQLTGGTEGTRRMVAAAAAQALGIHLHAVRALDLADAAPDREGVCRLWEREALLTVSALLVEIDDADPADAARAATWLIEHVGGLLVISSREPVRARYRPLMCFDVGHPTADEQRALWTSALGPAAAPLNGQLESIIAQFRFDQRRIREVGPAVDALAAAHPEQPIAQLLWDTCRQQARGRLEDLAQRIDPAASWNELVLPDAETAALRGIVAHLRQRATVYETWGFSKRVSRGLGISALFAGPSGTGKTFAAEVLAGELRLDLYKIDLSQVVSKYIGETEKNLRRLFDAAEESGAILLFDEADALFGKRSEVRDSHDRYANIEVSYLLQRMEAYRGLAILTTNLKEAVDTAFLRRLRFVVKFPFPDAAQRARIWRGVFPANTPVDNIDWQKLSRLNIAGGNIRNIAMHAAFLAADAGEPVRMRHLASAARSEYAKLEKPLVEQELAGWV